MLCFTTLNNLAQSDLANLGSGWEEKVNGNTSKQLKLGFKPTWYAVIQFEHDTTIKKYIKRRLDPVMFEKDALAVKEQLYRTLYTNNWEEKINRAKSIWGVEYNCEKAVPHLNVLIEKRPFPYNKFSILERLIVRDLPQKCQCLSKYLGHTFVEPIFYAEGLNRYIPKNRDSKFLYQVSDLCH